MDRVSFGRFADGDILDGSSIAVHLDYSSMWNTIASKLEIFILNDYLIEEG